MCNVAKIVLITSRFGAGMRGVAIIHQQLVCLFCYADLMCVIIDGIWNIYEANDFFFFVCWHLAKHIQIFCVVEEKYYRTLTKLYVYV